MSFNYLVFPSAGSLSVAVVAAFIFILQIWFSTKGSEFRWFRWAAAVSFSTIVYAVGILLEYNASEGPINRFGGLLEWTAVIFLVHALYGFVFSRLNIPSRRYHLAAGGFHVLILILLWSTNIFVSDHFVMRRFLTLGKPFVEADIGPLGPGFMLYALGASINAIRLWIVKEKEMEPHSRAYVWGASFWILLGAHDAAAAVGLPSIQYIMEYGFLGFSGALLYTMFSDYLRTSDGLAQSNSILRKEIETRKRVEQERGESEERYRTLFELESDAILLIDDETQRIVEANEAALRLYGYSREELLSSKILDLSAEPEKTLKGLKQRETHIPLRWHLRKDGSRFPVEITRNLFELQGREVHISAVRDISSRLEAEKELRETRELLMSILDNSPALIYVNTPDSRYRLVNKAWERYTGKTSEEVQGRCIEEVFSANTARGFMAGNQKVMETGLAVDAEESVNGAEGKVFFYTVRFPLRDEAGHIDSVCGISFDITTRKRAEEALKKSEGLHKEAQRVAHIGHWELDPDIGTPLWSEEIFRIFGLDPDEGEPSFTDHETHVHPEDWPILNNAVRKAGSEGTPFDLVFRIVKPGGEIGWMHAIGTASKDDEGNVTKLFGTAQDITALRQTEEALRESELKLRLVTQAIKDVFWMSSRDVGEMFYVSPAYETLWERSLESVYQSPRSFLEAILTDDLDRFLGVIEKYHRNGRAYECEYRIVRKDGEIRWIHERGFPLHESFHGIELMAGVCIDITERKKAEEALRRTNEALSRAHKQRKILSKRLIDLLEKDRRQIAMELHDHIGQTLTSLKMDIEMIREKLKPEQRALGARITEVQEKAIQAIKDVKNISRGLRPGILDALGLVPSLRELFNEIQQQTDIEIRFFSRGIPERFAPEKEVAIYRIAQEALTNIIRNAKAKNVFVNLIRKDENLSLSIEDDGVGFDQDKGMTFSKKGGPLGIPIMRERAEQLDGEFTLESRIGKGTHVLVEIPL
jgi:PAS domain S-box-containing protein